MDALLTSGGHDDEGPGVKTRRYTYRMDGFVSVYAPFDGGKLLTKPITFSGEDLRLNTSSSAAGSVRVELQHATGQPVEGFRASDGPEIYGDAIEHRVTWQGGQTLRQLQGQTIRLLLLLQDADVYASRFGDRSRN